MLGLLSVVTQGSSTSTLVHHSNQWKDGTLILNKGKNIERTEYRCSNGHVFTEETMPLSIAEPITDNDLSLMRKFIGGPPVPSIEITLEDNESIQKINKRLDAIEKCLESLGSVLNSRFQNKE